jgi:hypothetical protein
MTKLKALPLQPMAYVNNPKALAVCIGYQYQNSCEQTGWIIGRDCREVCWRDRVYGIYFHVVHGLNRWKSTD